MDRKNYQQVKRIFQSVLEITANERADYLDKACNGNNVLRGEVERLLDSFDSGYLENPAIGKLAELVVGSGMKVGQEIGHYKIVKKIGAGGMGEVYLAEDTKLDRRVALKILPQEFAEDTNRMSRFVREAKSASSLNNPNIITIHEIGEAAGKHFIATEYIEGKTLRDSLQREKLSVKSTLEISIQIASALQAAHAAGIIHRDIKPENVMIRPDGLVKILDFGIAKLSEPPAPANVSNLDEEAATAIKTGTTPGMIIGTANYMSPEQARGQSVDARSDIFSFGVVLYEIIAGKKPFEGETAMDVIGAILHKKPIPVNRLLPEIPHEIERIINKMLRKDRDERYQKAKDLALDLKDIKEELEFQAKLERGSPNKQTGDKTQQSRSESSALVGVSIAEVNPSANTDDSDFTPNNLTANLSPIVGREKEIAEIRNLLLQTNVRLVTMTGIGGTGKTRLSQAVAQSILGEFADGVFFIKLAAITNPELVASTIAQPLGVKEAGGKPILEILKDYLRGRQMLIVVDNFEQVMTAAPDIAELIAAASGLKILITSRVSLHLIAEREFVVPPLEMPSDVSQVSLDELSNYEAIRLFVERAQNAKSNFALREENASSVTEICARLDGLPLAIELAAARVKILTPNAILDKLENRLKLLTGGAKDLPARQQTMRGAVEWSYDLLNEDEKTLFRRLAVFAGGFTFEAAEAVVEEEKGRRGDKEIVSDTQSVSPSPQLLFSSSQIDVLDLITSLVDKSLLVSKEQADGEMRFRMLEVVREYALESLEANGEAEAMRRSHAAYFLAFGEEAEPHLQSAESVKWLDRLEDEHDNLRDALRWSLENDAGMAARLAAAIRAFWNLHTHFTEGRRWLEAVLESCNSGVLSTVRYKLLNGFAQFARHQGDYETARKAYEEGLAASRATDDKRQIALSSRGLGTVAYRQGDFTAAREFIEEGLAINRELNDKSEIAISLNLLGDLAYTEGNDAAARLLLEESLAISRQLGNKEVVGSNLNSLGAVAYGEGNDKAAHSRFAEALATTQELGDKISIAFSLDGCAALAAKRGEWKRAARLAGAAKYLHESIGFETAPVERRFRECYLSQLKAKMDEDTFAKLYEQGRKLKLEEAVALCLEDNNSEERYQPAKDLRIDLKDIRQESEFQNNPERTAASNREEAETQILEATTTPDATASESGNSHTTSSAEYVVGEIKNHKLGFAVGFVALLAILGFGYWFLSVPSDKSNAPLNVPLAVDAPKSAPKLYWQMTEAGQLAFIRERARHIQTLIGDEPTEFNEEELRAIKIEIDDYVEEKDSLSQKPFEEGLRVIYGRASQYAPLVIRAYEARQVPPVLGLYQAMVESEYHDCPTHPHPTGPVGLFQFNRKTAAAYGLTPKDYCNVEKQSDAAARLMSDLTSDFGDGKSSATLGLLGFAIGENGTRDYLRQLRGRGITERSFWTIFRHRQNLQPPLSGDGKEYVPRFFAAAIIGETPEAFELSTPPLSTLREKDK